MSDSNKVTINDIEDFDLKHLKEIDRDIDIERIQRFKYEQVKNETMLYKPVDQDFFPAGAYIYDLLRKPISHFYEMEGLGDMYFDAEKLISQFHSDGYKVIYSKKVCYNKSENKNTFVFEKVSDAGGIVLVLIGGVTDVNDTIKKTEDTYCSIYSTGWSEEYSRVLSIIKSNLKKVRHQSNNVNLVISSQRGYTTTPFELPKTTLDIKLNYGTGFVPIHTKIITELNKEKGKGLVLLHGVPGTGKTHYLKYLASKIQNKRVLFIPPYLADFITSPEMTPFLIQNSDSVLFIEDAERVITDRNISSSTGVSNILNLTDGILSDILNIQIVATFNMDKRKIDTALLRKGRLIAEHKFDALPKDDAQNLLDNLGFSHTATGPMTLTEIYNINDAEYKSEEEQRIGFKM